MNRNKWLLLGSSLGVLMLLIVAALQENVFREWRRIQAGAYGPEGPIAVQLRQVVNPSLGIADRCVSCHVAIAPGEQGISGPAMATHRFVVHDPAEFGCTTCHGGQGRATEKADAHGTVPFWPQPMLPPAMGEAGCGTCHAPTGVPHRGRLDRARAVFDRLDCLSCHRVDDRGGTLRPDKSGVLGPELTRAGVSGHDANWYESHLKKGTEPGPWKNTFAPISDADRAEVAAYLATRMGAPRLIEAKSVFHSTGCLGCHKVSGIGGDDGPDLTRAGEKDPGRADFSAVRGDRTLANWFAEHVRAPAAVVAGSLMPAPPVTAEELDSLTLYTLSLRRREIAGSYLPRDRMRVTRFGEREFASDGETLFGTFCSGCHGRRGQGLRAPGLAAFPSIANPDFLSVAPDALIAETIARGRPGRRMRAWTDGTTGVRPDDIPLLVSHLRALGNTAAPVDSKPPRWVSGSVAVGERVFAATCSGCHGATGGGGEGPALNNPVLQQFATDTYFVQTITRGRRGTAMPAFAEPHPTRPTLAPAEVESVVSFIRTWGVKP
jgi:mono/diheme cytochrome c family protein